MIALRTSRPGGSVSWKSLSVAAVLAATTALAQAGVVQMSARAGAGLVDWGGFGAEGTSVAPGDSISPVTVAGASTFTVLSGSTYNADFDPADNVLALFDFASFGTVSGSFDLTFGTAVFAAGAQVQANGFGAFAGLIAAYDASNNLLGSFTVSGANGGNGDGSAAFAGISSTDANIKRLVFSGFGDGAGINALSYSRVSLVPPPPGGVPEPGSLALAGLGVGLMLAARRRLTH